MITGFSKWPTEQKRHFVAQSLMLPTPNANLAEAKVAEILRQLESFLHTDPQLQRRLEQFAENTISNFFLPYSVVPNFFINGKEYLVPMVTEESSVVAACSKAASYWYQRGGFHAQVASMRKVGQVHLEWMGGNPQRLQAFFTAVQASLKAVAAPWLENMEKRGGGLQCLELHDHTAQIPHYYQIWAEFDTCDAMGANLINTILELWGEKLAAWSLEYDWGGESESGQLSVLMSILSNYTPHCLVRVAVSCTVDELASKDLPLAPAEFARKMLWASKIAQVDPYRAATHNKGIFNGVDGVVLATGNDFRAVEAAGHAHAALKHRSSGPASSYRGLSQVQVEAGKFQMELELPLAVGTVGGLTGSHPLAAFSLQLLGLPSAGELMAIIGAVGLAQNFAALKSLVTSGIQQGHMKMHLTNICYQLAANRAESEQLQVIFAQRPVSFRAVSAALADLRK